MICYWCDKEEAVIEDFCLKCADELKQMIKTAKAKPRGPNSTGLFGIIKQGYAAIDNRHIELKDI